LGHVTQGEFLEYFDRIRGRTRRVAVLIPADRVEWSLRPGGMTLGDLVRHIAVTEREMWAETVAGRPSRYRSHGRELADSKDAILALLDRLHGEAMAIFAGLPSEAFAGRCLTPAGAEIAVGKWLRAMIEHEVHHRGQIYMMLSMLGVATPPLFGLTSEDLRARVGRTAQDSRGSGSGEAT
jgi:uncharacterized damage-inducible protein DinB